METDRSLLTRHNALLLQNIARDLVHALSHRYDNTWHGLCWTSQRHWLEQVGDSQLECELFTWSEQTGDSWLEPSISRSQTILTLRACVEPHLLRPNTLLCFNIIYIPLNQVKTPHQIPPYTTSHCFPYPPQFFWLLCCRDKWITERYTTNCSS